jgi:hypothetical protein
MGNSSEKFPVSGFWFILVEVESLRFYGSLAFCGSGGMPLPQK